MLQAFSQLEMKNIYTRTHMHMNTYKDKYIHTHTYVGLVDGYEASMMIFAGGF